MSQFFQLETNNPVEATQATQAGHSGIFAHWLHTSNDSRISIFKQGDWIVKFPVDLQNQERFEIYTNEEFLKKFRLDKTQPKKRRPTIEELYQQVKANENSKKVRMRQTHAYV